MPIMPSDDPAPMVENFLPYSPFLPGGIPLDGTYARFGGRLYACRSVRPQLGTAEVTELILISTAERPGTEWQLTREYPSCSHTEWTKTIARTDAEETFACSGSIVWHGITITGLDYLPKENLVGGYMGFINKDLEATRQTMEHLHRLDVGTWHGFVPLDELEKLEIRREPWPETPQKPFWRFFR